MASSGERQLFCSFGFLQIAFKILINTGGWQCNSALLFRDIPIGSNGYEVHGVSRLTKSVSRIFRITKDRDIRCIDTAEFSNWIGRASWIFGVIKA